MPNKINNNKVTKKNFLDCQFYSQSDIIFAEITTSRVVGAQAII
jgi:hypothetical protein